MRRRGSSSSTAIELAGDGLHGRGGPLPLCRPDVTASPFDVHMRTALEALGYPACDDYHAPGATGCSSTVVAPSGSASPAARRWKRVR